jgi:hypothetical protein
MDHNTKLFKQIFTHSGVPIFNKLSSEIKNIWVHNKIQENLINFLYQKQFLLSERTYYSGFSASELWMSKDKLRLDISWSGFVCGCRSLCAG